MISSSQTRNFAELTQKLGQLESQIRLPHRRNCVAGYTVVEVDTTGLSPAQHDRTVELSVVYVSHEGQIQDHWSTLINPSRDVGPTRIHGHSASDVRFCLTCA